MASNQEKPRYEQNSMDRSGTIPVTPSPQMNKQQQQQEHLSNEKSETTSNTTNLVNSKRQQPPNGKPKENVIASHLDNFQQQQSDYAWLIAPRKKMGGSDHFHNSVVHSTFPASLSRDDFDYYIDMTFSDFPEYIRIRMKTLFNKNDLKSSFEDLIFDNHPDGTLSAILIQILTQKNAQNELEMVAGLVSVTQKSSTKHHSVEDNWQNQKSKVQRALQYIFGNEAKKELAQK